MIKKIINFLRDKSNIKNPVLIKLINGMAWNISGTVLSKSLVMIASIITARMLGVDKNGEYSVINSTVLMFSTFSGLGLGTTATRFVSEYKEKDNEKCSRIIGMTYLVGLVSGVVMAMVLVIFSDKLSEDFLRAPHLSSGLRISAVLLITNTINIIQQNTMSGFERFKDIAKISIVQGVISLPVFTIFTWMFGVQGLISGHIAVSLIATMIFAIKNYEVRKKYNICTDFKGAYKEIDIMWKFSLPSMLCNVMVGPVTWIGNTIMTSVSNGYFELGIFNAANQWRNILTFLPAAIGNVILPAIIAHKGDCRLERINILLGWIIVICIAVPVLAVPEAVAFLYGSAYMGDSFNISILFVVMTCCILSYKEGIGRNLVSFNLMWWGFLSNSLWAISFLIILCIVRTWGAVGMAVSYFAAYFVSTVIFVPFYVKRGVVKRELIISKEIIMMWLALAFQICCAIISTNIIIRTVGFVISISALLQVAKTMIKQEKITGGEVNI